MKKSGEIWHMVNLILTNDYLHLEHTEVIKALINFPKVYHLSSTKVIYFFPNNFRILRINLALASKVGPCHSPRPSNLTPQVHMPKSSPCTCAPGLKCKNVHS